MIWYDHVFYKLQVLAVGWLGWFQPGGLRNRTCADCGAKAPRWVWWPQMGWRWMEFWEFWKGGIWRFVCWFKIFLVFFLMLLSVKPIWSTLLLDLFDLFWPVFLPEFLLRLGKLLHFCVFEVMLLIDQLDYRMFHLLASGHVETYQRYSWEDYTFHTIRPLRIYWYILAWFFLFKMHTKVHISGVVIFCPREMEPSPIWTEAAVNLGVLICIDCSGFHRSLGVHISVRRNRGGAWMEVDPSGAREDVLAAIGSLYFTCLKRQKADL